MGARKGRNPASQRFCLRWRWAVHGSRVSSVLSFRRLRLTSALPHQSSAMAFARSTSLFLAICGAFWAVLLLLLTFGFLQHSVGALLILLFWLPGFVAWYGYVRHALGHYLFRQARITWLVSIVANAWSMWLLFELHSILIFWSLLALFLSLFCVVSEWDLRESERPADTNVTEEEFTTLLEEHRRKQR